MNSSSSTSPRKRRLVPGWWYLLLCIAPIGFVIWMWSTDAFGDQGMQNVFTALGIILAALLWLLWFVFASGATALSRFGLLASTVLVIVGFTQVVRFEGVTGSMIPSFSWRWTEPTPELAIPVSNTATKLGIGKASASDFPGFLGARRDLTVRGVRLARDWKKRPPKLLWKQPIGRGWSAFAIVGGVAVTQEQRGDKELVTAYELESGEVLWSHAETVRKEHPVGGIGPRCTPLIDEGRVYALGATGILVCLDGADGSVRWRKELPQEFGITPEEEATLVDYGRSTSPLVVGRKLIVPVGGANPETMAGLVALDKDTGKLLWKGPPRHISCASPAYANLAGRAQILVMNESTASGHDPETGALLWEHPWPARTSQDPNCSQPCVVGPDRVLVSKGYGQGSALLRLLPKDEQSFDVEVLWKSRRSLRTKFTNVAVHGDHLYGLSDGIFECVELETGKRTWKNGRYGHGQILLVGDLLLLISEQGELLLIEATPDQPNHVLGRIQALEGKTWNNLALAGDLLAVRNAHEAAVYRLAVEK